MMTRTAPQIMESMAYIEQYQMMLKYIEATPNTSDRLMYASKKIDRAAGHINAQHHIFTSFYRVNESVQASIRRIEDVGTPEDKELLRRNVDFVVEDVGHLFDSVVMIINMIQCAYQHNQDIDADTKSEIAHELAREVSSLKASVENAFRNPDFVLSDIEAFEAVFSLVSQ